MSYRQHWVGAQFIPVRTGTSGEIHEALGGVDEGTGDAVHLVLKDGGNREAFVLTGTFEELRDLAGRHRAAVGVAVLGSLLLQTRPARTLYGHNTRPNDRR